MKLKKIGIIILNWNNYDDTKKCVESVLLIKNKVEFNVEIYLIDNNSSDKSGEKLKKEFSNKVHFFKTRYNGGYTGGNNFGIKQALKNNCEYILVLNNDLEIENISLTLTDMMDTFKHDSKIGIIGFSIFDYETKKELNVGGFINNIFDKVLNINTENFSTEHKLILSKQRSVCGCAIAFSKSCLDEIGLFDESFFMYAEEHDICLRALSFNWKVVKIKNKESKIYRKTDPVSSNQLIWYYNTRNIFCAYKKNLSFQKYIFFSTLQVLVFLKQIIIFVFTKKAQISYKIFKGLTDSLFFKNCKRVK